MFRPRFVAGLLALIVAGALAHPLHAQPRFSQVNLVSDVPGSALFTDANLVNAWGMAIPPSGNIWVSDNGTGFSTIYNEVDGTPRSLVVTIPPGGGAGKPTGQVVANVTGGFMVSNGDTAAPALFIFASENGTISGWNAGVDGTHAIQQVSTDGAIYKGIALVRVTSGGPRLYAANFHAGTIDVFDSTWVMVTTGGGFHDPNLPPGYAPFNVANLGGQLFVAYARQDTAGEDDVPGPGLGLVDVFDTDGNLVRRFASNGDLDAPWGIVRAPAGFGGLGGDVLIGNFGDGRIHAFDFGSGSEIGALADTTGSPLAIDGLWGLAFGAPLAAGPPDLQLRLFFAAGPGGENHGLFGYLTPQRGVVVVAPPCVNHPEPLAFWSQFCGGRHGHGQGDDDGHGAGDGDGGHGHSPHAPPATPPDSLTALFACITSRTSTFGSNGCFTASCDLLQRHGRRTVRDRAAQQLLALELNRCAGVVCDTTTVRCFDDDADEPTATARVITVGDLAAALDSAVCGSSGARDHRLQRLFALAACVNGGHEGDEGDDDDGGDQARTGIAKLGVAPLGANPHALSSGGAMMFRLSATSPAMVRLAIYDAAGRLVAEPLHAGPVTGQRDVNWDGHDTLGRLVSPGTYFYRATTPGAQAGGRLVIVR